MAAFTSEKLIRFHHCDPAGIVFYPQYFVLFHELVEDWFNRGLGIEYADFISRQRMGLPTVHIDCDFRAPSKIGEVLEMGLTVKRIGTTSFTIAVTVQGGGTVRVTANQVLCLLSLDTGRVIAIPAELRERFERYAESAGAPAAPERRGRARGKRSVTPRG